MNTHSLFSKIIMIVCALTFMFGLIHTPSYAKSDEKAYMGVIVHDITPLIETQLNLDYGVVITWIDESGAAEKAGLMKDDIILKVNGEKIDSPNELRRLIAKLNPDDEVRINYLRKGKEKTVKVKLTKLEKKEYDWTDNLNVERFRFGERPYLGITLQKLDLDLSKYFGVSPENGVLILKVHEDSPAEKAGLKSGDIILKVDDEKVADPEHIEDIISDADDGDEITLNIYRHKEETRVTVKVEIKESKYKIFLRELPEHLEDVRMKIEKEINLKKEMDEIDEELKDLDSKKFIMKINDQIIHI